MISTLPLEVLFGKRTLILTTILFGVGMGGCQPPLQGYERFIPPPAAARVALVSVLDAWKSKRLPEEGVGPLGDVHVVDKQRRAGQQLVRYEILGEVTVEKARGFAVRLTLENPEESPLVRFLVVGEHPLWVWRQEDFEMISHWMHPMDDDKESDRPADPSRTP